MFDLALAKQARDLCKASYSILPPGAVEFFMPDGRRRGFLLEIDGVLNRVWTGSSSIWDWMRDVEARPNRFGVHTGAYETYMAALPSMLLARKKFPETITVRDQGHSLGGGDALISYEFCADLNMLPPRTYEGLRVFTYRWKSNKEPGVRFTNELDLVPHLPRRGFPWDYIHQSPSFTACGNTCDQFSAHSLNTWTDEFYTKVEGPLPAE